MQQHQAKEEQDHQRVAQQATQYKEKFESEKQKTTLQQQTNIKLEQEVEHAQKETASIHDKGAPHRLSCLSPRPSRRASCCCS